LIQHREQSNHLDPDSASIQARHCYQNSQVAMLTDSQQL